MRLYFNRPEIPAIVNDRLKAYDVILPSDKGLVIIDRNDWYKVMKEWDKFTDLTNALNLTFSYWYLIAADQKEGEFQDECQSICDFESFVKFANAVEVFDFCLVPISWNLVDRFCETKNTSTDYWVEVLDN